MADSYDSFVHSTLNAVSLAFAVIGLVTNLISITYKVIGAFTIPKVWKYSILSLDVAYALIGIGLCLFLVYNRTNFSDLCKVYGFILLFGLFDVTCGYLTSSVILLCVRNPGTSNSLSKLHRTILIFTVTPQKLVTLILTSLTVINTLIFDADSPFSIECFPVRRSDEVGSGLSILIFCLLWFLLCLSITISFVNTLRLWKANRVFSSSSNIWQSHFSGKGRVLQKFVLADEIVGFILLFIITYYGFQTSENSENPTWVTMVSAGIATVFHGSVSNFGNIMWNSCCCRSSQKVDEPHRKLKKLELIRIEAPGKLRMRAIWNIHRAASKRGLMKVYGTEHLRAWATEIVILGMLRKVQHPSLLKCMWTNSSNPYYETMTLITGEVVTSDSRIICLELTNSGTLDEFLNQVTGPLPESLQRVVVHDIAEGLSYLHCLNIVHSKLVASSVYLKGSLPSTVLRAAIGDFEDAQIYGSLQQSMDVRIKDKRHFFLPDIRSFALIALELISIMCELRLRYHHLETEPENAPLMTYLSNMISETYDGELVDGCDGSFDLEEYTPATQRKDYSRTNDYDPESICDELARSMRSPGFATAQKVNRSESNRHNHNPNMSNTEQKKLSESLFVNDEYFIIPPDQTYRQIDMGKSHSKECERSESNISLTSRQAFEAFPVQTQNVGKEVKKNESMKWLAKPGALLKSIKSPVTVVTLFKAPFPKNNIVDSVQKHDVTHEKIIEEEIDKGPPPMINKGRRRKKMEVNDFISPHQHSHMASPPPLHSPRYITPEVIECAAREDSDVESRSHTLERKQSEDANSAVWSPIPIPSPDIDIPEPRDPLDEILDCLPGMAEVEEVRKSTPSILELLSAKGNEKPLPNRSKFELIDYYTELKGKHYRGKEIISASRGRQATREQNFRYPIAEEYSTVQKQENVQKSSEYQVKRQMIKTPPETVRCKKHSKHTRPKSQERRSVGDDVDELKDQFHARLDRIKQSMAAVGNVSAVIHTTDNQINKRNMAQSVLKRKLDQRGSTPAALKRPEKRNNVDLQAKYDMLRRDRNGHQSENQNDTDSSCLEHDVLTPSTNCERHKPVKKNIPKFSKDFSAKDRMLEMVRQKDNLKHYSSFSSDDSSSSLSGNRRHDVLLTSGEMTSLSSADPADEHIADVELPHNRTFSCVKYSSSSQSRVTDSGFDSESMSSEMSSDIMGFSNPAFVVAPETYLDLAKSMRLKNKLRNAKLKRLDFPEDLPEEIILDDFVLTSPHKHMSKTKQRQTEHREIVVNNLSIISDNLDVMQSHRPSSRLKVIEVSPASPLANDEMYPNTERTNTFENIAPQEEKQNINPPSSRQGIYTKNEKRGSRGELVHRPSNAASRRYRELTEKGVPLRVSVIDGNLGEETVLARPQPKEEKRESKIEKREYPRSEPVISHQELFTDLESKGFFHTSPRKNKPLPSPRKNCHPTAATRLELVQGTGKHGKKHNTSRMSLDDIIREIPEECTTSVNERMMEHYHIKYPCEDTLLNQPTSEESEAGSINAGKCTTPVPMCSQPAVMVDAELVIDRIFSQKQMQEKSEKPFKDFENDLSKSLGLDREALVSIADISLPDMCREPEDINENVSLLSGMSSLHVHCCKQLSTRVPLLTFKDLLPANLETFKVLSKRLHHVGQLGSVGNQILAIIEKCWLSEMPPMSTDLVDQLVDPVTETEL